MADMAAIKITTGNTAQTMIDWHTHILPYMDDGSKNAEESIEMLRICRDEGVRAVVLSSHYYPHREDPVSFFNRRNKALEKLKTRMETAMQGEKEKENKNLWPLLIPAAEVYYFNDLAKIDDELLSMLSVGESSHIIIEMPGANIEEEAYSTLEELIYGRGKIPVLAHVDRYFHHIKDYRPIAELVGEGMKVQLNTESLNYYFSRRKAIRLINDGLVHMITSDCHDLKTRPPGLKTAAGALKGHLDDKIIQELLNYRIDEFIV